jgi:hypothetical protein
MRSAQEGARCPSIATLVRRRLLNNWITWQLSRNLGIIGASYVPTDWGLNSLAALALVALVGPA